MGRLLPLCVGFLSVAGLATTAGAGAMYRFEDDQGVVHYTNVPGDPRYSYVRKDPAPAGKPAAEVGGGPSQGLRAYAHLIRAAAERYGVDTRLVEAIVQAIDRQLAGTRLCLSGNYFAGLAIEDCVARSLGEWARVAAME